MCETLIFLGHLLIFRAENTLKSGPFKTEEIAQPLTEQLQNNFDKVQKMTFRPPKGSKMTPKNRQNEPIFYRKSQFLGSFINLSS